jgi:hypothetical protein
MKGSFSLEDWLEQMNQMKKMGPLCADHGNAARANGAGCAWGRPDTGGKILQAVRSDYQLNDIEGTPRS